MTKEPSLCHMPIVFTGHGYPMNAVTDNPARAGWRAVGERIGKPEAIVAITGHWETSGQCIRIAPDNPQLFDVWDLPDIIYTVRYSPVNSPRHVKRVMELLEGNVYEDNTWGIDHALWTTLSNMYPDGDVPVVPMSVDVDMTPEEAFELGRKLAPLRHEGVLLFATGNIVHQVDMVDHNTKTGLDWAVEFDQRIKDLTLARRFDELLDYRSIAHHELAVPTVDHYYPFLTILGASDADDEITVFNNYCELASLSMTSYLFS